MVLVDSSVWIDHFRRSSARLTALLDDGDVCTHALVIGELACGQLTPRRSTLELLHALPRAAEASEPEVLALIEHARLAGSGLGIVDVHLLAAAKLSDASLWTHDRALSAAAARLGLSAP